MYKKFISLFLFQFLLSVSYALDIDRIIVFGDSLSDTGNIYNFTVQAKKIISAFPLIPRNPPYYQGRFSNGPIWAESLAEAMDVPLVSYAYAGAWAEPIYDSGPFVPFSLGSQVDFYLVSSLNDFHKDKHLYVIWSGSNDYIHGRYDKDGKPDFEYPTTNTSKVIQSQIDWLIYYGAKNFLIINLPDLSLTPQIIAKGPEFVSMAAELSKQHNIKLAKMLIEEQKQYPDVKIISVDVNNYFSEIIINPEKLHLKNVKDPCYDGDYLLSMAKLADDPEVKAAKEMKLDIINNDFLYVAYVNSRLADKGKKSCANPDEYLFWDKLHPTRIVHQALAKIALQALKGLLNS